MSKISVVQNLVPVLTTHRFIKRARQRAAAGGHARAGACILQQSDQLRRQINRVTKASLQLDHLTAEAPLRTSNF